MVFFVNWEAAEPNDKKRLVEAIKGYSKSFDKGVIIIHREGEDKNYLNEGFKSGEDGIDGGIYAKNDESRYLLYSKKL